MPTIFWGIFVALAALGAVAAYASRQAETAYAVPSDRPNRAGSRLFATVTVLCLICAAIMASI